MSKISNIQKENELIGCFLLSRECIDLAINNKFSGEEPVNPFNKDVINIIMEQSRINSDFIPTIHYIIENLDLEEKKIKESQIKLNRYKKMIQREIVEERQLLDIVENNIKVLKDLYVKRKVIKILKDGLENIELPAREFINSIHSPLTEIEINDGIITEVDIYTGFKEIKEEMEYQLEHGVEFGYKFGLRDFDAMAQDQITKGTLTYIVGRPSNYKTGTALNLAQNSAMAGTPTALFSNEMKVPDVYRRILSRVTGIKMAKLKKPDLLTKDEWNKLDEAINLVKKWPLYVVDSSNINIDQMNSAIGFLCSKYGVEIVFQDYMQLIRTRKGNIPSEEWEFGHISEELRMMAMNHNIALISLTQANRSSEARDDKRPTLRDIRNSGKLEQDAHNVFYVYRDEFYYGSKSEVPNHIEIGALKLREGELKRILLHFNGACATLSDADPIIVSDKSSDYIGGGLFS